MTRVLIVDDHPLILHGLQTLLSGEPDLRVAGTAADGEQAVRFVQHHPVDLIILDINMPVMDGFDTCRIIQTRHPEINVLVLTTHNSPSMVERMKRLGARAMLPKNVDKTQLLSAVRAVSRSETFYSLTPQSRSSTEVKPSKVRLTMREKEVLRMIVWEQTTQEIANQLSLSINTVETHRRHLLKKLNVRNTAGLVRTAVDRQLVDLFRKPGHP